ncbi:restriction endonuclease [Chitinophaga filiformis]|uniref:restriction endonuclease n=1 Tax=Chitinophaga filiformis TaxID=104663 RepID=UPI001F470470|nr:restriction endonuclease [Chitinophaga filiformis]MCF6404811.1 restriction endonuclease [Chitinophaga filiformis]
MVNNDELDWQSYEEVTAYIYRVLGAYQGIKVKCFGRDCKVKGKSGVDHQIDVLTEQFDGVNSNYTVIECKFLKKKITKEIVMKLHSEMQDAGIKSGIIVCKSGFTSDTQIYAEHVGIKLVEFREVGADDLNGRHTVEIAALNLSTNITMHRPIITKIDFGSDQITDEYEIQSMYYAKVNIAEGREIPFKKYMMKFQDELSKQPLLDMFSKEYPAISGKIRRKYGADININKISFIGYFTKRDTSLNRSFVVSDKVWMVMREIFEKNSFMLSKGGFLFKNDTKH